MKFWLGITGQHKKRFYSHVLLKLTKQRERFYIKADQQNQANLRPWFRIRDNKYVDRSDDDNNNNTDDDRSDYVDDYDGDIFNNMPLLAGAISRLCIDIHTS